MSTEIVLIFISVTILISYILDILSSRTRVPPIIFMILSGIALKVVSDRTGVVIPHVEVFLPTLGAVGLILIVLDAGLDLDLNKDKLPLLRDSFLSALVSMALTLAAVTAFFFMVFGGEIRTCLINALPFSIISSAIAIPGARHIEKSQGEFVTYESSFSDILGILLFNLVLYNTSYGFRTLFSFGFEIIATVLVSVIFSLGLTILIEKINHKIKYLPIFSALLLAYAISKQMHFSPLILVLVFGLMLNNFHLVIRGNLRLYLDADKLRQEINSFNSVISETTFVVKIFFFLLLGYSVSLGKLVGMDLVVFVVLPLLGLVYAARYPALYFFSRSAIRPLIYLAPRGLITILLFMSIPTELRVANVDDGLIVWVILGTSAIMTLGVLLDRNGGIRGDGASPERGPAA
ncbi:MAG: cation:proton antiporter [Elusimicrobiales bacterium]|nr:cation:proton antiporter [Elusimicrobiales bacterium]